MNDDDKLNSNSQGFRSNKKTGCKNLLVNHCPGQKKKTNRLSCLRASLLLAVSLSPAMVFASPVQDYLTDGYFWYTQGRSQAAREKWQKALQISPGNQEAQSALQELDRFNPATLNQDQLNQARQFARQNRYQDAITAYDKAFNGPPPTSYYAAEYYETLSGTESGWSDAIAGLRKLASTWPSNPEFQVTLARVLSYREETRREAIDKLAKLASNEQLDENLREKAVANWRQALLWLNADVDDKPLYVSYLNSHPDATVEGTMNNMSKPAGELGKAYELLEANQLDRARTIFSKIRSDDPENAEAVAGLGIIELRHRRFSNAASLLEKAIQKDPGKQQALSQALEDARFWSLMRRAGSAHNRRWFSKAENLASTAMRSRPSLTEPVLLLAAIKNSRGQHEASLKLYEKVLKKHPGNKAAQKGRIENLLALKNEAEARQAIKRYKLPKQEYQAALKRLSIENMRREAMLLGKDPAALSILEDALVLAPDNPWVRLDLARQYHQRHREDEAISLFDNLLDAHPGQYDISYAKALYHEENKQWQAGLNAINQIPDAMMNPERRALARHLWARNEEQKARQMVMDGDHEQARKIAQKLKSVGRLNDPGTDLPYAEVLAELGDEREALRIGRQLVDPLNTPDINTRISFANLLLRTGHRAELISRLDRLEAYHAEQINARQREEIAKLRDGARMQQADVSRLSGQYDQALEVLQAPPLIKDHLDDFAVQKADILLAQGKHESALAAYKDLIRKDPKNEAAQIGVTSAAMASGDLPLATGLVNQGLEALPDSARLLALRSELMLMSGKNQAASRDLGLALDRVESEQSSAAWVDQARQRKVQLDSESRSHLTLGLGYRDRGNDGLDAVTEYAIPLEFNYDYSEQTRFGFNLRQVVLDGPNDLKSVEQKSQEFNLAFFGGFPIFLANPDNFEPDLSADGTAYDLFYQGENWSADLGSKPSGFAGDRLVGGVDWRYKTFNRSLEAGYSRRAVKESVLSYAGSRDPQFGGEWGGVTRSGLKINYHQQLRDRFGFYTNLGRYDLSGDKVASNNESEFQLGGYWQLQRDAHHSLTVGLGLHYRKFSENLRFFTLGHGGYFSPQRYLSLTVPVELKHKSGRLSYRLGLAAGVSNFEESSNDVFPEDDSLQARWEQLAKPKRDLDVQYAGREENGFLYNIQSEINYQLDSQFTVGGWIDANNADNFNELGAGIYLRYFYTKASVATPGFQEGNTGPFKTVW